MVMNRRATSLIKDQYYHLWIAASKDQVFFANDLDRAFFISLLQDCFSPRKRLSYHAVNDSNYVALIDLVAFSLTDFGVNLLVCAVNTSSIQTLGQQLLTDYAKYIQEQQSWEVLPFHSIFVHDLLTDEHEALAVSREIHLLHDDWEYDRYSSIGFYLQDRRGDWIQAWHLANLFHNDSLWYRQFMLDDSPLGVHQFEFIET
ncbi:MAG: hypothetical protein WAO28_02090 [Candidatus Microsaccharimonas sp.]